MTNRIDILLYVALSEEADSVLAVLGDGFAPKELSDANLTVFFGSLAGPTPGRDFNVAMIPAGKMGNTHSASVASLLLEKFKPRDVVVVGIAGSLANDMEPGDVFIPDSINEYLANSAVYGQEENWTFTISGNHFSSSRRLLNRFQNFSLIRDSRYEAWQNIARELRSALITTETETALTNVGLKLRGACKLYAGDDLNLASGPAVGKGKAFTEWVKRDVDRKVAAMEMETAGVYDAALVHAPAPRTIAIRGISDYADERKAKIEATAQGVFRALSIQNAVALFKQAVAAGLFEVENFGAADATKPDPSRLDSRARSIFVIGGETGETADVDAELPRLIRASMKLGNVFARAGAQLHVCSPFPDSADYYTAMGYADAKVGGIIHFHSPLHATVEDKRQRFRRTFGQPNLSFQDWNYPTPETDEQGSWSQAWLLAQIQALERADIVVALGGKVSKTASMLLHLAEVKGLPIIPFAFIGGAAGRNYKRRDWTRLNPDFDARILENESSVEQAVEIANRLILDRVKRTMAANSRPKKVFISVARQDAVMGQALEGVLKSHGIEAVFGEREIVPDQLISATIEQALHGSDIVAVLWSRSYAQSPWCYDELVLALSPGALDEVKVWLFNLDDSSIVPTQARRLPAVSVRSEEGFRIAINELLR